MGFAVSTRPWEPILWAAGSAIWPLAVYVAAEVVFGRRVARLSDRASFSCPARDREWERAVSRKAIAWGLGSYAVAALVAWGVMP